MLNDMNIYFEEMGEFDHVFYEKLMNCLESDDD